VSSPGRLCSALVLLLLRDVHGFVRVRICVASLAGSTVSLRSPRWFATAPSASPRCRAASAACVLLTINARCRCAFSYVAQFYSRPGWLIACRNGSATAAARPYTGDDLRFVIGLCDVCAPAPPMRACVGMARFVVAACAVAPSAPVRQREQLLAIHTHSLIDMLLWFVSCWGLRLLFDAFYSASGLFCSCGAILCYRFLSTPQSVVVARNF
jgi:hypothetical protein